MITNGHIRRVLKAPTEPITDFTSLQLPVMVSDKEDGIRCIIHPLLGAVTQTLKPLRNDHVRIGLTAYCPTYLDGEVVTFDEHGRQDSFHDVQSKIMSKHGEPHFEFRVFDWFGNEYAAYQERWEQALELVTQYRVRYNPAIVTLLNQTHCYSVPQLEALEESALRRGKEGLMLRSLRGYYKQGRSTWMEGYLLKVKRFLDDEALVIDIVEQQHNCNDAIIDARGYTKRSKHKAGMRPTGLVGKLVCTWRGHTIYIDGFNDIQRAMWFQHPELIVSKTITFRYQPFGMLILPRAPKFKGIRHDAEV